MKPHVLQPPKSTCVSERAKQCLNLSQPYRAWTGLGALALFGSLCYGGSLGAVLHWPITGAALWLTLSAGLGWFAFLPALVLASKKPIAAVFSEALATMAYGEAILLAGAVVNLLLRAIPLVPPGIFNVAVVGFANAAMCLVLGRRMAAHGLATWKTALLWAFVLNASGAVFFRLFCPLLEAKL